MGVEPTKKGASSSQSFSRSAARVKGLRLVGSKQRRLARLRRPGAPLRSQVALLARRQCTERTLPKLRIEVMTVGEGWEVRIQLEPGAQDQVYPWCYAVRYDHVMAGRPELGTRHVRVVKWMVTWPATDVSIDSIKPVA